MPSRLFSAPALRVQLFAMLLLLPVTMPVPAQEADAQQAAIEIVRLQHRSADSIREAIEPLLDSRGSIGQMDNNLIIATTRSNLQQLKELISQLDLPRKTLRISIDFDYQEQAEAGTVQTINVNGDQPLSVQVLEGETAVLNELSSVDSIELGDDVVVVSKQAAAGSEIRVRAEQRGEEILVELDAYALQDNGLQDNAPGSLARSASTTLSVAPGRWQLINPLAPLLPAADAAADGSTTISTTGIGSPAGNDGSTGTATASDGQQMAIRVDILP